MISTKPSETKDDGTLQIFREAIKLGWRTTDRRRRM